MEKVDVAHNLDPEAAADLSLDQMTALTELELSDAQRGQLPEDMRSLARLRILRISLKELRALPASVRHLTQLEEIFLRTPVLDLDDAFPKLASLPLLRLVDLRDLGLGRLSESVGEMTQVQRLLLGGNRLTALPPELSRCRGLRELSLESNWLERLPPELGQLTELHLLNLSFNHLSQLPPELGEMRDLEELELWKNPIVDLPPEIAQLESLRRFSLGFSRFEEPPASLAGLVSLEELALRNNQPAIDLGQLFAIIACLPRLRRLDLRTSELTSLPKQVALLTNLEELDLTGNRISSLPDELGALIKLKALDLDWDRLDKEQRSLTRRSLPGKGWQGTRFGTIMRFRRL